MNFKILMAVLLFLPYLTQAQLGNEQKKFSLQDSLRGSLNENRNWWDVLRYDIEVKPDYNNKSISGKVAITFKEVITSRSTIQIDLQQPLMIDSILIPTNIGFSKMRFSRDAASNVAYFDYPSVQNTRGSFIIYYHGTPRAAKNAPWDGGWIWTTDSLGRPWMSVAVQGLGASAWYPCKDHQSDEPDEGASLTVIVPDSLMAVANARLVSPLASAGEGLHAYTWEIKNPINNYNIIPSVGKYVNWTDTFQGINGKLDLSFWALDYNLEKARKQFEQAKSMLRCFEYWFGPYPFYEDGYKLVETPFLGMEHQSAIAYGNGFKNGYRGRDLSATGWGNKWDFIIIHESGHEWFANNITTKDIADMWVHEGFTNYSETLYTEWLFGRQAGDEYNYGIRKNIRNDKPIIGIYGVNEEGSGDMYYKAGNMIHIIRKVMNNDERFRQLLRGLNKTYWHQTVTTQQIENYVSVFSGIDFSKTFDQYLRTTQIPQLEYYFSKDGKKVSYRWTHSVSDFNLPLVINNKTYPITTKWKTASLSKNDLSFWKPMDIQKQYYITAKQVAKP